VRRLPALLLISVSAALLAAGKASAHATLLRTQPAGGAVVAHAPREVRVFFDDTVTVGSGNAAVANATEASVEAGPATAHGRVLVIPLRPGLGDGDYSVRWSIVSDDGHHERGVFAFGVGSGRAPPRAVLTASVPLGLAGVVFHALFYLGLLVAAGATVFWIANRRFAPALRPRLSHLLFFALLLSFVGCSGLVQGGASGTRNGLVLEAALGVAAAGAAAAALAPLAAPLLPVAGACSLALAAAPTLSGHALDHAQPWALSVPADLGHLGAAAVWLGGLVAVLVVLPRADLSPDARALVVRRFSSVALVAVGALAASGLLRALTELRALDQVWSTTYGRALVVKTALFLPLLALGALNRTRLLEAPAALRRSVRVEVLLLAAVVAVVSVLVQLRPGKATPEAARPAAPTPPAAPYVLPPRGAVVDAGELGPLAVGIGRERGSATVTLLDQSGAGAAGRHVLVDGRRARSCGAGCYRADARPGPLRVTVGRRTLVFEVSARAPDASALLARVTRAYRASRSIVFDESLRSGAGAAEETRFEIQAPDRLAYRIRGGPQAVVIGARRWDRPTPTGRWLESQQAPFASTRPYWSAPTNVHLVAPRTLTFLDRTIPAWFRLTLDARSRPIRLRMTAAAHFMLDRYVGFDVPLELSPPSR
jgi:copper transport protein